MTVPQPRSFIRPMVAAAIAASFSAGTALPRDAHADTIYTFLQTSGQPTGDTFVAGSLIVTDNVAFGTGLNVNAGHNPPNQFQNLSNTGIVRMSFQVGSLQAAANGHPLLDPTGGDPTLNNGNNPAGDWRIYPPLVFVTWTADIDSTPASWATPSGTVRFSDSESNFVITFANGHFSGTFSSDFPACNQGTIAESACTFSGNVVVPEPASLAILGFALGGLGLGRAGLRKSARR